MRAILCQRDSAKPEIIPESSPIRPFDDSSPDYFQVGGDSGTKPTLTQPHPLRTGCEVRKEANLLDEYTMSPVDIAVAGATPKMNVRKLNSEKNGEGKRTLMASPRTPPHPAMPYSTKAISVPTPDHSPAFPGLRIWRVANQIGQKEASVAIKAVRSIA